MSSQLIEAYEKFSWIYLLYYSYFDVFQIDIANGKTGKTVLTLDVSKSDTILDVKKKHIKES